MQTFLIINLANIFIMKEETRKKHSASANKKLSKHTVIAEIKARGQFVISTKWQVSKKTKLRNEKAHSP